MIAVAHAPDSPSARARIGPNAITRVAEAMPRLAGAARTQEVFAAARLAHYLRTPPAAMVDENEVIRLHRALHDTLGRSLACRVAAEAGTATGDYLLAHRIPAPVTRLLKTLPAGIAARFLVVAIRRHAWTFAGSGTFAARAGNPVRLAIANNPLCRGAVATDPLCDYYAATFERLFRALVHPRATVTETACEACGADACRFEIRW